MKASLSRVKQLLTIALLTASAGAFAVDTDGDGVEDVSNIIYSTSFDLAESSIWNLNATGSTASTSRTNSPTSGAHTPSYFVSIAINCLRGCLTGVQTLTYNLPYASTVSYWVKMDNSSQWVEFFVDGVSYGSDRASTSWTKITMKVPAGNHVFKWREAASGGFFSGYLYLDDVSITTIADNCPLNSNTDQLDTDKDGVGNVCDDDDDNDGVLDISDNCPLNVNPNQADTDGDSLPDACTDSDDDNDGVLDGSDRFPLDPTEWSDTDSDGTGNNADTDDDNDTVLDASDNCPLNANTNQLNTDGDALGNVCDADDDNDGIADSSDKFPLNAAASSDTDTDGFPGSWNAGCDTACQLTSGLMLDNCPTTANSNQQNTDGDIQGDVCDNDDDNDGYTDGNDRFPLDVTEWLDNDNDGVGDNADMDDDNDTVLDAIDNCPLSANTNQLNTDSDSQGNFCDDDDDNDGMIDPYDIDPLDPTKSADIDHDGLDNYVDDDDDGDGVLDVNDPRRLLMGDYILDVTFNQTGYVDTVLTPSGSSPAPFALFQQPDGKLIVGGAFDYGSDFGMIRYNADGTLDASFGNNGKVVANGVNPGSMIRQSDGRLVVAGGYSDFSLSRFNVDGSVDTTFDGDGNVTKAVGPYNDTGSSVVQQADGKLVIAGTIFRDTSNSIADFGIVRYNVDGSLDTSFGSSGVATVVISTSNVYPHLGKIFQQADGKLVIVGHYGATQDKTMVVRRLNANGTVDPTFSSSAAFNWYGTVKGYDIFQQADGKLLVRCGYFVRRLNLNGTTDTTYGSGGSVATGASAAVMQKDGKLVVGYANDPGNNHSNKRIAINRFDQNGVMDASFAGGSNTLKIEFQASNWDPTAMLVQADGKLVFSSGYAGSFQTARLLIDTDGDATLDGIDNCSSTANQDQLNSDGDVQGDACDTDDDNDGVLDVNDAFPLDAAESVDTDNDGIGNNTDSDDDNDGMPDLWEALCGLNPLLNDTSGDIDGDGFTNLQEYNNNTDPTIATAKIKNDFNGDRKADVLLRNTTMGDWNLAQLNGLTVLNQSTVGAFSDIENIIVSAGDFDGDGDGDADILTRGTDNGLLPGTFHIDLTNGASVTSSAWLSTMSTDLNDEVMSTKDFNKDGKADVLLRNSTTGVWTINYMNGTSDPATGTLNASIDLCYTMKGDGDYDGNGYPDILLRKDNCGGASYPWLINTTDGDSTILASGTATGVSMNTGWATVVADQDFNGDGKADILMRALTGAVQQWMLFDMNGAGAPSASGLLNIPVQSMWQFASEADLNGDGNADVLLRSTDTGQWYADLLNGRTILSASTVSLAMNPVWTLQGIDDNNGDGKGDILLRNSANGSWYLYLMNGLTIQANSALPITTDLNYTRQND